MSNHKSCKPEIPNSELKKVDLTVNTESATEYYLQNLPEPNDEIVPETEKKDPVMNNDNLLCKGNFGSSDYHDNSSKCSHSSEINKCAEKRKNSKSKKNLFTKFIKY